MPEPSLRGPAKKNVRILVYSYLVAIVHLWESGIATAPLLGACGGLSVAIIGGAPFFSHRETELLQIYQLSVVNNNHL